MEDDGSDHPEFSKTVMDEFPDEPAYRTCRKTLNSSAKLESLVLTLIVNMFQHNLYDFDIWVLTVMIFFFSVLTVRQIQQNGSHHMGNSGTSSIHGQSMSKLEQF